MKIRTAFLALLVLVLLAPSTALAQADKGTLLGTVLDTTGAGVPDTEVKVTEVNTNIVHTARTNETGSYTFPSSRPATTASTPTISASSTLLAAASDWTPTVRYASTSRWSSGR